MKYGFIHEEDGQRWLRCISDNGEEYDEAVSCFVEIMDLTNGENYWRHVRTQERIYPQWYNKGNNHARSL